MDEISVFLALASPLLRMRLGASLQLAPGIRLVGEASTAVAAVERLPRCLPQILLTEQRLLKEPTLLALLARRHAPRVVVATATDPALGAKPAVPHARTLPFTLPPIQLAAELRRVLKPGAEPAPAPPGLPAGLQERFHFTGPLDRPAAACPAPRPAPEQAQGRRRAPSPRQQLLVAALQGLQQRQHQRDAVTGLAGPAALEQAQALLPAARQPVTIVRVEVRDERGGGAAAPDVALLRSLSAALRANVRREDLVYRAGPASFVIVLPGVRREEAARPATRVRAALAECGQGAVGVSYWEVGAGNAPGPHHP